MVLTLTNAGSVGHMLVHTVEPSGAADAHHTPWIACAILDEALHLTPENVAVFVLIRRLAWCELV
jgi:hypothetical protein